MTDCHDMKEGTVYVCGKCGLELQVVRECTDCGSDADACGCGPCTFRCCDEDLTKKE